jgi:hypothetical protein
MSLGPSPQDEEQFDLLTRPRIHTDEDPARQPLRKMFEPGDDPKGWDRASLRLNTHPLHPRRRLQQSDFVLPRGGDALKTLGDALVFGGVLAALSYCPLWMADVMVSSDLKDWIVGTMVAVALAGMSLVFMAAWAARRAEPY